MGPDWAELFGDVRSLIERVHAGEQGVLAALVATCQRAWEATPEHYQDAIVPYIVSSGVPLPVVLPVPTSSDPEEEWERVMRAISEVAERAPSSKLVIDLSHRQVDADAVKKLLLAPWFARTYLLDMPRNLCEAELSRVNLQGEDLFLANLERATLADADLRNANLAWANLKGATLDRADLRGADLSGARLEDASLVHARFDKRTRWPKPCPERTDALGPGASLVGAALGKLKLSGFELEGADLSGADLRGTDLTRAKLRGATLACATYNRFTKWPEGFEYTKQRAYGPGSILTQDMLDGVDLSGQELRGAKLSGLDLRRVESLERADLTDAHLENSRLDGVDLRSTRLGGANLSGANLSRAIYSEETTWPDAFDLTTTGAIGPRAHLSGMKFDRDWPGRFHSPIDLNGADLSHASFEGCDMARTNFEGADLTGAQLASTNLTRANLIGSCLKGANLNGATLSGALYDDSTVWPANFDATTSGGIGPGAQLEGQDISSMLQDQRALAGLDLNELNAAEAHLTSIDFEKVILDRAKLARADMVRVRLSRASLKGADLSQANLEAATARFVDLTEADLTSAHMTGAKLEGGVLRGARLDGACLQNASARGADLSGASLRGADLECADLHRTNLTEANLTGANLKHVDLSKTGLHGARLTLVRYSHHTNWPPDVDPARLGALGPRTQLSGVMLDGVTMRGAELDHANLSGASLIEVDLTDASLLRAELNGAMMRAADLSGCLAEEASFEGAVLVGARFDGANLLGASFRGADLRGASFEGTLLRHVNLQGATLEGACLEGALLQSAHFDDTTSWPAGFDPLVHPSAEERGTDDERWDHTASRRQVSLLTEGAGWDWSRAKEVLEALCQPHHQTSWIERTRLVLSAGRIDPERYREEWLPRLDSSRGLVFGARSLRQLEMLRELLPETTRIRLDLRFARPTISRLRSILSDPALEGIQELDLTGCGLDPATGSVLARSPYLSELEVLELGDNPALDATLMQSIGDGVLPHLVELSMWSCGLVLNSSFAGLKTGLRRLELGATTSLRDNQNVLGHQFVHDLVCGASRQTLEHLDLSFTGLGTEALHDIAEGGKWPRLRYLNLSRVEIGSDIRLRRRDFPRIEVLELSCTGLGPDAVAYSRLQFGSLCTLRDNATGALGYWRDCRWCGTRYFMSVEECTRYRDVYRLEFAYSDQYGRQVKGVRVRPRCAVCQGIHRTHKKVRALIGVPDDELTIEQHAELARAYATLRDPLKEAKHIKQTVKRGFTLSRVEELDRPQDQ